MSPSCSRRFLLHFLPGYKMVISHTPPKRIEVFPQTMILLASILLFFPLLPNSSSSFSRLLKYQHLQKVFPDWLILGCVTMLPRYNGHLCHITHATLLPSICVSDFQTRWSFLRSKTASYSSLPSPVTVIEPGILIAPKAFHGTTYLSLLWPMGQIMQSLWVNLAIWKILLWSLQPPL